MGEDGNLGLQSDFFFNLYNVAHNIIESLLRKLTCLISILSAKEASKLVSKCTPIIVSLELEDKEPWDTIKAQLLMKIDTALSPSVLSTVRATGSQA